jgi:hypothetical protein
LRSAACTILLLALVAPTLLPFVPSAGAASPLAVDAGRSQVALDGGSLALSALVVGGQPPYAIAWSFGGSSARFSAPGAASTSFSSAGLAVGDDPVDVSVTDALGAVATDTVLERVDVRQTLLDATVAFAAQDAVVGSAVGGVEQDIPFTVPPATGSLDATLTWSPTAYTLFLDLVDPNGVRQGSAQGFAGTEPERITVDAHTPGTWTARVVVGTSGPVSARVKVVASPSPLPGVLSPDGAEWGQLDAQHLHAGVVWGTAPFTFTWDRLGNAVFDASGDSIDLAFATGAHVMRSRVTDARGFRDEYTFTVHVHPSPRALWLTCGGDMWVPHWAMEFSASNGTCWMHEGHHTYWFGGATYAFDRVDGSVYSVEQEFAPPTQTQGNSARTPIFVEASLDGRTWTTLGTANYTLLTERQSVPIHVAGSGQPFRFFRLHEPPSASQGLSGYLDGSQVVIEADDVAPAPASVATAPGTEALSCANGDILEASFFPTHPCTFGGVDRYDSASFYQTYHPGPGTTLTAIDGSFILAPFRADDWYEGHESAPQATFAHVQVSVDGVHWDVAATVPATYGVPTPFHVDLPSTPAAFVRLFPEYHADFDDYAVNAPLHHVRGYFLASNLTLTGAFPTG